MPESSKPFPLNVLGVLKLHLAQIEGVDTAIMRPLRTNDPNGTIGIFPESYTPTGFQIGGKNGPVDDVYNFTIQHLVKHTNEEEGGLQSFLVAHRIKNVLHRTGALRTAMHTLSFSDGGLTEKSRQADVTSQRYLSNGINSQFTYLSVTGITVKTETL